MLVIDKDVAPPELPARGKYPFESMEVGDSLFFYSEKLAKNAYNASSAFLRRTATPWKFSCRKAKGGWRLWRII